jgi:DNA-binding transcriptional regulator LsrR (DeoR family)
LAGGTTMLIAARRYFLDGATKSEIATELGISRFRVARLLDLARSRGVVRIEIALDPSVDAVLSRELAAAMGIRNTVVARTLEGPESSERTQLGRLAAEILAETVDGHDVLGISWGRTLHAMVDHLPRLPACAVVQLVGSVPSLELRVNSLELVRRVAERAQGPVYPLHVPLIVDSPETAAALRADPHVARTLAVFPAITRAVVGIGAWTPTGSTVRASVSAADAKAIDAAGVVADMCSVLLDANGGEVRVRGLPERSIAISIEQLRAVPDVLAIASGASKAPSIHAALRSGLVHRLITTETTARELLALGA